MKTRALQTLWWDWLSTAERLGRILNDQSKKLMARDIDAVHELQPDIERLMNRMRSVDDQAIDIGNNLASELGVDANMEAILTQLSDREAIQVRAIVNKVKVVSKNIAESIETNRRLAENEYDFINGTIALHNRSSVNAHRKMGMKLATDGMIDNVA